ncbi:MAG: terpene cyclase/mutase family protein [Planctomycetes bacterium]|nr:terpene cyclase/mutase family protein [Planctomycetota bacterium]
MARPVVVLNTEQSDVTRYLLLFMPAIFGSFFFHAILVVMFILYVWFMKPAEGDLKTETGQQQQSLVSEVVKKQDETFTVVDEDPAAVEFDTDIQFNVNRIENVSVPGQVEPNERVGIVNGDTKNDMMNLPAPGGYGGRGQGGVMEVFGPGNVDKNVGQMDGYNPRGLPLDKSFEGRSGATREKSLREGGGTTASEVAVTEGLRWLVRQQLSDGRWVLSGNDGNPVAATALGLLPFLAAGKTHKPADKNPYDKNIEKALNYLKKAQDPKTGFFGGSMYSHGLATIAMCEAYGLSQDPALRRYAQGGVNLLVATQHEGNGGWSYGPSKDAAHRDLSISGWQIMALKSGQMAGLSVPSQSIARCKEFLNKTCSMDSEGYGYTPGSGPTQRMTVVGLLCRQYMENWGPANERMIKSIKNYIKIPQSPGERIPQDVYYYYYATQVLHHFGGESWKKWNDVMREQLIAKQDRTNGTNRGSWGPEGDPWGGHGGRLLMTSLNLLTLEVYYRYLPLYYRDAGYGKDAAVKMAL